MTRSGSPDFVGFYTYRMQWKDNSTNELGFHLYNFDWFTSVGPNVQAVEFDSFDLPSFTPDPCFAVTAYNAQGESDAAVYCFPD